MSSNPKYHHLIPRTYMRSWKHLQNSIYIIDKNKTEEIVERNIDNIGGINHYHSIVAGMVNVTSEQCDIIFEPLKDFKIVYEGYTIETNAELNQYFYDYADWEILYPNEKKVSKAKKNQLYQTIKSTYNNDIENTWSKNYEDNWNNVVKILSHFTNVGHPIIDLNNDLKRQIIDFIVSLDWRNKDSNKTFLEQINNIFSSLFENSTIPKNERILPFIKDFKDEIQHDLLLSAFREFQSGKGIMSIQTKSLIENADIALFIAGDQTEYITSDRPVTYEKFDNKTAIYFPVTPKILCVLGRNPIHNKLYITKLSNERTKEINYTIFKNCIDYCILKENNRDIYF